MTDPEGKNETFSTMRLDPDLVEFMRARKKKRDAGMLPTPVIQAPEPAPAIIEWDERAKEHCTRLCTAIVESLAEGDPDKGRIMSYNKNPSRKLPSTSISTAFQHAIAVHTCLNSGCLGTAKGAPDTWSQCRRLSTYKWTPDAAFIRTIVDIYLMKIEHFLDVVAHFGQIMNDTQFWTVIPTSNLHGVVQSLMTLVINTPIVCWNQDDLQQLVSKIIEFAPSSERSIIQRLMVTTCESFCTSDECVKAGLVVAMAPLALGAFTQGLARSVYEWCFKNLLQRLGLEVLKVPNLSEFVNNEVNYLDTKAFKLVYNQQLLAICLFLFDIRSTESCTEESKAQFKSDITRLLETLQKRRTGSKFFSRSRELFSWEVFKQLEDKYGIDPFFTFSS